MSNAIVPAQVSLLMPSWQGTLISSTPNYLPKVLPSTCESEFVSYMYEVITGKGYLKDPARSSRSRLLPLMEGAGEGANLHSE